MTVEERLQKLEDRAAISEVVINYAGAIDRADWELFADCVTDVIHVDFSEAGLPAADFPKEDFVGFTRGALSAFDGRQHLSPNHVVTFLPGDPDRAICRSYMFAQHYLRGVANDTSYVMHGDYANHMVRTAYGWKIEKIIQHLSWNEGDPTIMSEARAKASR